MITGSSRTRIYCREADKRMLVCFQFHKNNRETHKKKLRNSCTSSKIFRVASMTNLNLNIPFGKLQVKEENCFFVTCIALLHGVSILNLKKKKKKKKKKPLQMKRE